MAKQTGGRKGFRWIDGKEYMLCGRGTKEQMKSEAADLRKKWSSVRVVSMTYCGNSKFKNLIDDFACYVF